MAPPKVISLTVPSWEYRQDGLREKSTRYVVYKIIVHSETAEWIVYRRYSDFAIFDGTLRRILPSFQASLPPRETIRPLAGLLGFANVVGSPSADFLERRRRGLDDYVRQLMRNTADRQAIWNHPTMLSFFDLPSINITSSSKTISPLPGDNELTCPISIDQWPDELYNVREQLRAAQETRRRADAAAILRGHDHHQNYLRHLRRQMNAMDKLVEKLSKALDFYAQVEQVSDAQLESMSDEFQGLVKEITLLASTTSGGPSASLTVTDSLNIKSPKTIHTSSSVKPSKAPLAQTPTGKSLRVTPASSSLVSTTAPTAAATTPTATSPQNTETTLAAQERALSQQDAQLSELSAVIQRHRSLGLAINSEIRTLNIIIVCFN